MYMKKKPNYENTCDRHAYNKENKNVQSGGGHSMMQGVVHRCTRECPWHKKCFVCKTEKDVREDVIVIHKCAITKEEIPIHLGKQENNEE